VTVALQEWPEETRSNQIHRYPFSRPNSAASKATNEERAAISFPGRHSAQRIRLNLTAANISARNRE